MPRNLFKHCCSAVNLSLCLKRLFHLLPKGKLGLISGGLCQFQPIFLDAHTKLDHTIKIFRPIFTTKANSEKSISILIRKVRSQQRTNDSHSFNHFFCWALLPLFPEYNQTIIFQLCSRLRLQTLKDPNYELMCLMLAG